MGRYLICTASIGSGHIKAAEAIREELAATEQSATIRVVDFMTPEVSRLNYFLKKLYLKMLAFLPNIYDFLYNFSGSGSTGGAAVRLLSSLCRASLADLLREFSPDVVICTHPFPAGAAASLRKKGVSFRLAVVLTDYSVHNIWLYSAVDQYFVATSQMREELIRRGFDGEKILASGIPITLSTTGESEKKTDESEPRRLLLMGGGLGLGGLLGTLGELEEVPLPLSITVIAGHNEKLYIGAKREAALSRHQIEVLRFSDDVPSLMKAADLLITKPGALTLSEAFNYHLPMLLKEPIPGPETENARYAEGGGAAVWLRRGESLAEAVREILTSPRKLTAMGEACAKLKKPLAAKKIVERIISPNKIKMGA